MVVLLPHRNRKVLPSNVREMCSVGEERFPWKAFKVIKVYCFRSINGKSVSARICLLTKCDDVRKSSLTATTTIASEKEREKFAMHSVGIY